MTIPAPVTETAGGARRAAFAQLMASGPVQKVTLFTGVPVWLVTGYAEARQLLADPTVVRATDEAPHADHTPQWLHLAMNSHMLASNPPEHTKLRRLVSAAFTRRRVEALEPRIAEISAGLLDEVAQAGRDGTPVDLVAEYSYPLPITVICELVGVPMRARDEFRRLSSIVISGGAHRPEVYIAAAQDMVGHIRELIAEKRARPAEDLLSGLIAVRDGGDALSDDQLSSMVFLLLVAGHETTVNLVTAGVHTLLTHPDQLARLRADPALIPAAVEEILRFDGPVMVTVPARTTVAVRVGEVTIPAGEVVVPAVFAANRDPGRFERPTDFDITRPENSHIAFGHGIHHCLGAPLARLEGRIAVQQLLARFPNLRPAHPDEDPVRTIGLLLNGITRLDVLVD
jgi:cytochrome P450